MSRPTEDPEFGSDAFLDVVANIVGILIILVVVVGLRAAKLPDEPVPAPEPVPTAATVPPAEPEIEPEPEPAEPPIDLETPRRQLRERQERLAALDREKRRLSTEAVIRQDERERTALVVAAKKQELAKREQGLSVEERVFFELTKSVENAQRRLDELDRELLKVSDAPAEIVKLDHDATPLSRTVVGEELHFRVQGGRVAFIPLEPLLEAVKRDLERQKWRVREGEPAEAEVGPAEGFRLRYRLEVRTIEAPAGRRDIPVGTVLQVTRWEIDADDDVRSETEAEALGPQSRFRQVLNRCTPGKSAVTLWVYPDSFPIFRALKAELGRMQLICSGRPMPDGLPIAGSPYGSRSAGQ